MEVGVDIVEVKRFADMQNQTGFLKKYFAQSEIDYIIKKGNRTQTIAGLYAAKEAVLKALGIGIGAGIRLNELCVLHDSAGKPFVEVNAQLNYYLNLKNCNSVAISISHDGGYAVAFCTIF